MTGRRCRQAAFAGRRGATAYCIISGNVKCAYTAEADRLFADACRRHCSILFLFFYYGSAHGTSWCNVTCWFTVERKEEHSFAVKIMGVGFGVFWLMILCTLSQEHYSHVSIIVSILSERRNILFAAIKENGVDFGRFFLNFSTFLKKKITFRPLDNLILFLNSLLDAIGTYSLSVEG